MLFLAQITGSMNFPQTVEERHAGNILVIRDEATAGRIRGELVRARRAFGKFPRRDTSPQVVSVTQMSLRTFISLTQRTK
jgi:hypothetical protein